jgi:hypothetical protein
MFLRNVGRNVALKKKKKNQDFARGPQEAWRQDELIGGKPPVVK